MIVLVFCAALAAAGCSFKEDESQPFTTPQAAVTCLRSLGRTGTQLTTLKEKLHRAGAYWTQLYALEPWLRDEGVAAQQGLATHDMAAANDAILEATTECDAWNRAAWLWAGPHDAHTALRTQSACNSFYFKLPLLLEPRVADDGATSYRLVGWSWGGQSAIAAYERSYGVDLSKYVGRTVRQAGGLSVPAFFAQAAGPLGIGGRAPAARAQAMLQPALDALLEVSPASFDAFATTNAPVTLQLDDGDTLDLHYLAVASSGRLGRLASSAAVREQRLRASSDGRLPLVARAVRARVPVAPEVARASTAAAPGLQLVDSWTTASDLVTLHEFRRGSRPVFVLKVHSFAQGSLSEDVAALKQGLTQHLKTLSRKGCSSSNNALTDCVVFVDLTTNGGGYVRLARLFADILFAEEQQPNQLVMSYRADSPEGARLFRAFYRTQDLHEPDSQAPVGDAFWREDRAVSAAGTKYRYSPLVTENTGVTTLMWGALNSSVRAFSQRNGDLLTDDEVSYYGDVEDVRREAGYRWPTDGRSYGGKTLHSEQVFFITSPHQSASAAAFVAALAAAHNFGTTLQLGGDWTREAAESPIERGNQLSGLVPGGNVVSSDDIVSYLDDPVLYPDASVSFSSVSNIAVRPDLRAATGAIPLCYVASDEYFSPHVSVPSVNQQVDSMDAMQEIVGQCMVFGVERGACASGFASAFSDTKQSCRTAYSDNSGGLWCEDAQRDSECGPAFCPLGQYVTRNGCKSYGLAELKPGSSQRTELSRPLPLEPRENGIGGFCCYLFLLVLISFFI